MPMIAPCGTFDYVTTVPADPLSSPWDLGLREPVAFSGDEVRDKRLVGYSPKLQIMDFGLRPETSDWKNLPSVMLSKITLIADNKKHAELASFSFFLDRAITNVLCSGDCVHLSRSQGGGLGISAIRDKQLIFAVGAVTTVPLGDYVKVRAPIELIHEAEAIMRKHDADFDFPEYPLEIQIGDEKRIVYAGFREMNKYCVFVRRAFLQMEDGDQECAAISLKGKCAITGPNASAELLDHGGKLEMVRW